MVKRLLIFQLILFATLVIINTYVYLNVGLEAPINPEEYCDTATDASTECIADLPGRFAKSATVAVSLVIFMLFPLICSCAEMICKAVMLMVKKSPVFTNKD